MQSASYMSSFMVLSTLALHAAHAQFHFYQPEHTSSSSSSSGFGLHSLGYMPHAAHVSPYQPLNGAAPHPSVVRNAQWEAELPPELSKSARFYSDPRIAAGLAHQSLLTNQEMAVGDREAEKIPREQVYKIFKNAGWIKRR